MNLFPSKKNILFLVISLIIVGFGQPAWFPFFGVVAAFCGYTLCGFVLLQIVDKSKRFWTATIWFAAVQAIQLSWSLTHPYAYIYFVYPLTCMIIGTQFGLLALLFTSDRVRSLKGILGIAACWTLFEWIRLFFLSGFSWNPIGLALAGNGYSLQFAAIGGVFLLSFWVMLTNGFGLRAYLLGYSKRSLGLWIGCFALPFLFGFVHLNYHKRDQIQDPFRALLVQTAFPVEEVFHTRSKGDQVYFVEDEWQSILKTLREHVGRKVDLIALPEFVVPFGTYTFVYPLEDVQALFKETLGDISLETLPPLEHPYVFEYADRFFVNNAFWVQGIANFFGTGVVCGLEDCSDGECGREYFSSALYFEPNVTTSKRYDKRVLVPMGEYIPFAWCKDLCKKYGISSSFTPGKEPKVWSASDTPFGVSICYEETFGDMMRQNRKEGAEVLVNLTSDVWYPNSRLPRQHLEHARLRTVEMGIPLVRACNTGVTGAIDCFGQDIALLGDGNAEWAREAFYVEVPKQHYWTLYTRVGDGLIIGASFLLSFFFIFSGCFEKKTPL